MTDANGERPDDEARSLLRRWQEEGSTDALDALVRLETAELRRRLIRRGGLTATSVSDVAAEAMENVVAVKGRRPQFREPLVFRQYLWRAATRLVFRRIRQRRRRAEQVLPEKSDVGLAAKDDRELASVNRNEEASIVHLLLQLLEPGERDVLERHYFRHETADDIAKALGVTREAAEMRLVRARRKLAGKLKVWKDLGQ